MRPQPKHSLKCVSVPPTTTLPPNTLPAFHIDQQPSAPITAALATTSLALLSNPQPHLPPSALSQSQPTTSQSQSQSQPPSQLPPQPHSFAPHLPNFLHSAHPTQIFNNFSLQHHSSPPNSSSAPTPAAQPPSAAHQMLANTLSLSTLSPARHNLLRPDPGSHLSPFPFAPGVQSPTNPHPLASAPLPSSVPLHPRHQDAYVPDDLALHFPESPVRSVPNMDIHHSALANPAAIDQLNQVRSLMDPSVSENYIIQSAANQHHLRTLDSHPMSTTITDSRVPLGSPILPSPQGPQPPSSLSQANNISLSPEAHLKASAALPFHLQQSHHNRRLRQRQPQLSHSQKQNYSAPLNSTSVHDPGHSSNHAVDTHQPHTGLYHSVSRPRSHHFGDHSSPMSHSLSYGNTPNVLQQRAHPPPTYPQNEHPAKRQKSKHKSFAHRSLPAASNPIQNPQAITSDQVDQHRLLQNVQQRHSAQDHRQIHRHPQTHDQNDFTKRTMQPAAKQSAHFTQPKQHPPIAPVAFELQHQANQENQPRFNYQSHPSHHADQQPSASGSNSHMDERKKLNHQFTFRYPGHASPYLPNDKPTGSLAYNLDRSVDLRPASVGRHNRGDLKPDGLSSALSAGSGEADNLESGSPGTRQKIPCPQCGKEYTRTHALNVHISTKHTGTNQEYECRACHKKFNRKDTLKRHIATTHELQRNWACKQCVKRFGQQAHLNTHVRTVHKKDRPYVCDQCAKSFGTLYNLNAHKNTHRRTQKAYACETCRKTYKIKSSLARHRRKERHLERSPNSSLPASSVEHPAEEAPLRAHSDALHGLAGDDYHLGRDAGR